MRFWDSSAVVPLLVEERNSSWLLKLHSEESSILVWWATPVDCASAIARLERQDAMMQSSVQSAFERLQKVSDLWHEIQPGERIQRLAMRLLRVHELRNQDSLQLAAAIAAVENQPSSLVFVCLDARLTLAAQKEGFPVIHKARR